MIYALTDDALTPDESVFSQVHEILECGVKFIQYRSKKPIQDENLIKKLINLCSDFGANLIINDSAILAKKLGAHGVHIGREDGEFIRAREILGRDKIIGVSCYNDINSARKFQNLGANYVAFGAMRSSLTKPNAPLCSDEVVLRARDEIEIPICVIGGINYENLDDILKLKPDMIAMIRAIYEPCGIRENLTKIRKKIDGYI